MVLKLSLWDKISPYSIFDKSIITLQDKRKVNKNSKTK